MTEHDDGQMRFESYFKSYLWTLPNFSDYGIIEQQLTTRAVKFAGTGWAMQMDVYKKYESDFQVAVYLKTESSGVHKKKVFWKVSLVSKDGRKRRMKDGELLCSKSENIEVFKIPTNLLHYMDIQNLVPDDCLIICLELVAMDMFRCQAFWKKLQGNESLESSFCLKDLSSDFLALFQSEEQTDVVLHAGDESFPAHKLILAARSKVFAKEFLHDAEGNSRYSVFIDCFEACDVKLMLEYIYSGTVRDIPIDRIYSLYSVANKYEIEGLQRMCFYLMRNISKKNAGNIPDLDSLSCQKLETTLWSDLISKNVFYSEKLRGISCVLFICILVLFLSYILIR